MPLPILQQLPITDTLVATRYPDLISMRESIDTVKQTLADTLEVWKEILEALLESLYISMPRRVAAVIRADGWYTKY